MARGKSKIINKPKDKDVVIEISWPKTERLEKMIAPEMARIYEDIFGIPADHQDYKTLYAAIMLNKRIKYLTESEIKICQQLR